MNGELIIPSNRTTGFIPVLETDHSDSGGFTLDLVSTPLSYLIEGERNVVSGLTDVVPVVRLNGNIGFYLELIGAAEGALVDVDVIGVMQHTFGRGGTVDYRYDLRLLGNLTGLLGGKAVAQGSATKFAQSLTWTVADFGTAVFGVYSVTPTVYQGTDESATIFVPSMANLWGVAFDFNMSHSNAPTSCNALLNQNV